MPSTRMSAAKICAEISSGKSYYRVARDCGTYAYAISRLCRSRGIKSRFERPKIDYAGTVLRINAKNGAKRKQIPVAATTFVLLMLGVAHAHSFWANGQEVDPITKRVCCGRADAKMLPKSEVHAVAGGYKLDDTGEIVPYDHAQPSVDGQYWVFRWNHQTQCFFAPFNGT